MYNDICKKLMSELKAIVDVDKFIIFKFDQELTIKKDYLKLIDKEKNNSITNEELKLLNSYNAYLVTTMHKDSIETDLEHMIFNRARDKKIELNWLDKGCVSSKMFFSCLVELCHELRWSDYSLTSMASKYLLTSSLDNAMSKIDDYHLVNGGYNELVLARNKLKKIKLISNERLELMKKIYNGDVSRITNMNRNDIDILLEQLEVLRYTSSVNYVSDKKEVSDVDKDNIINSIANNVKNSSLNKIMEMKEKEALKLEMRRKINFQETLKACYGLIFNYNDMKDMRKQFRNLSILIGRLNNINHSFGDEFTEQVEEVIKYNKEIKKEYIKYTCDVFSTINKAYKKGIVVGDKVRSFDVIDLMEMLPKGCSLINAQYFLDNHFVANEVCGFLNFVKRINKSRRDFPELLVCELGSYADTKFKMSDNPRVRDYISSMGKTVHSDIFIAVIARAKNGYLPFEVNLVNKRQLTLGKTYNKKNSKYVIIK